MRSRKNEIGQRYGRLLVIEKASPNKKWQSRWLCLCDCGTKKVIMQMGLRSGGTKSCGCLSKDFPHAQTHGHYKNRKATVEYRCWASMKTRCSNPKHKYYKNYGGRGITICDRWLYSFENFLEDMGEKPLPELSLDRIDNDGNYEPENCRWATKEQQIHNRRIKCHH